MNTVKVLGWFVLATLAVVLCCWLIGVRLENYDECIGHGFSKQYCVWTTGR